MKWYFRYSEFVNLEGNTFTPSQDIVDKIVKNFMVPLNGIRSELGEPLYIRSCYRSKEWELIKGRDGNSQHCFNGEGAVDVSLTSRPDRDAKGWKELFKRLDREYGRVAWYPMLQFFHCDNKGHQKLYFIDENGWQVKDRAELLRLIPD